MVNSSGEGERVQLLSEASGARGSSDALSIELDEGSWRRSSDESDGASRLALQGSHFLSTWGQRGWEFTIGLLMLELHPSSLAFVALWGLLDSALSVACGAWVGAYVDSRPRLVAATRMYLLQNTCVAISAATALALLLTPHRSGPAYWTGLAVTMAAGSGSTLGALGSTLSVEREWTKTLCSGNTKALASLNAAMKRIDLTCLIASPIMVGLILQYAGGPPMVGATLALLGWNLVSWAPEVALLRYAQRRSPALAADPRTQQRARSSGGAACAADSTGSGALYGTAAAAAGSGWRRLATPLRQQARAWALYVRQPAVLAALALALLYLTVLSWGTLMTAYLKSMGMGEAELAVYRGLGAASGILATITFPPLHRCLGLVPTAGLAIWLQLACLVCGVGPAVAAALGAPVGARTLMYALVWSLVTSRFGLWTYDLVATQLIQETVEHDVLGVVNGVQGSLQSLFQMLAYAAGVAGPSTSQFVWLMAGSCGVVAAAAVLVTTFALRTGCGRRLAAPPLRPVEGL